MDGLRLKERHGAENVADMTLGNPVAPPPDALLRALEGVLQRRRMRDEHARLMAENLEFMGVLSLYERALGLYANLSLEPLADRFR